MMKVIYHFQIYRIVPLLLILLGGFQPLNAATSPARIALVIGNSEYSEGRLKNPVNDADLMTRTLESKGFRVTTIKNATRRQMKEGIHKFTSSLDEQSIGLFYYAGHGIELEGNNYLIPVDAVIAGEGDIEYESINAGRLLNGLKRSNNGLNMIILDACRNNPYARSSRSTTRGLSRMQPASGSLILYATEPGSVADDGSGENGVFTKHLVDAINQEGHSIEKVFKVTARNVSQATGKKQIPYIEGVVLGEFYFGGANSGSSPATLTNNSTQNISLEKEFWSEVKLDQSTAMYQAYLAQYPTGLYAPIAKVKIEQASRTKQANLALLESEIAAKAELESKNRIKKQEKSLELLSIANSLFENGDYGYAKIQYQSVLYLAPGPEVRELALQGMKNVEQALIDSNANQTQSVANLGNVTVTSQRINSNVISGTYVSEITSSSSWYFNVRKHRKVKVTFQQDGNDITGINEEYNLKITGTRKGNDVTFITTSSKISGQLKGQWKISADGSKLTGK
jgi:uncharacterized caspase-like protein